jgi:hypothetical protein
MPGRTFGLVVAFILVPAIGRAERLPSRVFTTADGLAHNVVNRIVSDSRGYQWFCTSEGLSRFDGTRFITYGLDDDLPGSEVHGFLEARDGSYWVATRRGLVRFHPMGAPGRGAQRRCRFFSSFELLLFTFTGQHAPDLPPGRTASERRGRIFFEDVPPDFSVNPPNFKPGSCGACHSGPPLNQANQFLPIPVPPGTRFQTVLVSLFNTAAPGRALITGGADDFFPAGAATFDSLNAFKISPVRGVKLTPPHFHDNSAKTLEDVAEHYRNFSWSSPIPMDTDPCVR